MAYTIFEKKFSRELPPAVTITVAGRIGLNAELARIFRKNAVESVLFLSDIQERKIALRPTHKKDRHSYRIAYAPDLSQAFVCARGLLKEIGWDGKLHYRIPAQWDEKKCLLEFKMPKWGDKGEIVPVTARKQKAG
jgi:hypothetical protein